MNSTLVSSRQTHHGHTENAVAEKFESKKGHFCKVLTLAAATEESFMITNLGRPAFVKGQHIMLWAWLSQIFLFGTFDHEL